MNKVTLSQYAMSVKVPDYLEGIISIYLRNRRNDLKIIRHALFYKRYSEIHEFGQLLKESGESFGFELISKTGESLERLAAERKDDGIVSLLEEYDACLNNLNIVYESTYIR